jgi:hypothetical protein
MTCSSPRSKGHFRPFESLEQALDRYSLAASAAGLSVLALACPAGAEVVFTRAHVQITPDHTHILDLNHDGIADFGLHDASVGVVVIPLQAGGALLQGGGCNPSPGAAALKAGAAIGNARLFQASATCMASLSLDGSNSVGAWPGAVNRFLGFKFEISGQTHFGWARLSVTRSPYTATLTGYAYETVPDRTIIAGKLVAGTIIVGEIEDAVGVLSVPATSDRQPGTLGLLALGSPGLAIWRRDESANATH